MATPRSQQVDLSVTPYYHCMARCVRRAFLCGKDRYSGKNFNHRKKWVRDRLRYLAALFAVDVCAYAVMSNHIHLVLYCALSRSHAWSEAEVVERYTTLYPMSKRQWEATLSDDERATLVQTWRERLSSLSWFMRALSEFIARKANREEGRSGRFWEGRFKSQALVDETGLLTCMAYVDLNPVRAGVANTLEGSDFTSIQERLHELKAKRSRHEKQRAPQHLAPMHKQASGGQSTCELPVSLRDYVALVEWTGQVLVRGKRGKLRARQAPEDMSHQNAENPGTELAKRGICKEGWLEAMERGKLTVGNFLGTEKVLDEIAVKYDKKWVRGKSLSRRLAA